jgi:hypothetical protein
MEIIGLMTNLIIQFKSVTMELLEVPLASFKQHLNLKSHVELKILEKERKKKMINKVNFLFS